MFRWWWIRGGAIVLIIAMMVGSIAPVSANQSARPLAATCQCTDYAKEKRPDITNYLVGRVPSPGYAKDWPATYRQIRGNSFVGSVVIVGALVIFQPNVQSADPVAGHVAYVESIQPDGTFTISEKGRPSGSCSISTRGRVVVGTGVSFLYGDNDRPTQPRLELTDNVRVSPDPVGGEQAVRFEIPVKNIGGGNLSMSKFDVEVNAPGGVWKTGGTAQNIAAGASATLVATGVVWNQLGTWSVRTIPYLDGSNTWRSVEAGSKQLNRTFQVKDLTKPQPQVTSPAAGTNYRTSTVRATAESYDAIGTTRVDFVVMWPDGSYLTSRSDTYGGDGWWVDIGGLAERVGLKIKVHGYDAAGNEGISQSVTFNTDWTPPSYSFIVPSTVSNQVSMSASGFSDNGVGVAYLRFFLTCPNYWKDLTDSNGSDGWGVTYDISAIANGSTCMAEARGYDRANNERYSSVGNIQVRKVLSVTWSSSDVGKVFTGGTAELAANVTDNGNGIDRLDCYLTPPGSGYIGYTDRDPSDGWQCRWPISNLGRPMDGLRADAYVWDRLGNSSHSTVLDPLYIR